MKKIRDYLQEINKEYLINYEAKRIFNNISENKDMAYKFKDMSIIDFINICKEETRKLYDYLLSLPDSYSKNGYGLDDNIIIVPDYNLHSIKEDYIDGSRYLFLSVFKEKELKDIESNKFTGFYFPNDMVNMYVANIHKKYIYEFVKEIMYYSWNTYYNINENSLLKENYYFTDSILDEFTNTYFTNFEYDDIENEDVVYMEKPKILYDFDNINFKFRMDMWKNDIKNLWYCLKKENMLK